MTEAPRPRLRFVHVFAIGAGAMFSSGFFLLPGIAADETGPSLPLAYLLAGLLVLPTMLAVTELAVAMPRAGGPYHFYRRALGPTVATVGALGLWIALVLKSAFALVGIDAYLSLVLDLPEGVVGLALAAVFTGLNLAGARESAVVQVWLVAVLLVVLAAFVVLGIVSGARLDESDLAERFTPLFTDGALGLLAATAIVFVAFAGLPQVASVAGDIRDPERTIPRAVLAALAVATTIYVTGTFVLVRLLSADDLRDDTTPIATAAETFGIGPAVPLVVLAALAAFASTGNAGIMSASRYPLALARDGVVWRRFARLSGSGVPVEGVVLSGLVVAAVVAFVDIEGIAKLGSAFVLISFGLMNVAVVVLRRAHVPDYRPAFRMPGVPWLPAVGIATSVVLVVDLGAMPVSVAVAVAVAGTAWHLHRRRDADDVPGALRWQRRRRHLRPDDEQVSRLHELGPTADDRAPEILGGTTARRARPGAGLDDVRREAAAALAAAEQVTTSEVRRWLEDGRHPVVLLDDRPAPSEVHVVGIDAPGDPVVALAWAPGSDGRGPTVAIVTTSDPHDDRHARLAALVVTQLDDDELREGWPEDAAEVGGVLAEDAARRQGADRPPR